MNTLFNNNWEFSKYPLDTTMDTIFQSSSWQAVDIPHDWMIYDAKNLYEQAISCYRKNFTFHKQEGHTYLLRFEGVYMNNTIFLNGEQVMEWKYGYSTFDLDLTDIAREGDNEILVKSVYELPNSRWYPGSGIYRSVWFVDKEPAYIPMDGTYLSTKKTNDGWDLYVSTEYVTGRQCATTEATLCHTIFNADGKEIASTKQPLTVNNTVSLNEQTISLKEITPWDIENPYLYQIKTELFVGDFCSDSYTQNLGFRTTEFTPDKGFFLNGRHVKVHGSCEHHVLGALGAAINKEALRRQIKKLQEMGVNSIRTAHNMPSVEMMELADELGVLVYSESFDMWERTKTDYDYGKYFNDWWEKDMTSWIRRDRNHPSLIVWGIGNEIYDTHFERGLEITKMLCDTVHKLDPMNNAVTSMGSNYITYEGAQKCAELCDLVGYNYLEKLYDEHHAAHPDWCIFGSETSSTVQSRGIYHFPITNRLLTYDDQQCSALPNCSANWGAKDSDIVITEDRDREFCFGQYIWCGTDYIGEPTPYFTKSSYFGQIDTAGFEKDSFYNYQSEWTDYKTNPMIHLYPYWDFNDGQLIDICVNSNAPRTELFFNDTSLGSFDIDHKQGKTLTGRWQLPYEKGVLHAVAYDENGTVIAEDWQRSFGDPVTILAKPDKTECLANGTDLIFVEISTQDEHGTFVANGRSRMRVSVSGAGRLIGLDNGDSTDYDEYKGTSRCLFSGKLLAIIASKQEPGDIQVTITSPELPDAVLTLHAVETTVKEGISCLQENIESPENREIPVRKIEICNEGTNHLNDSCQSTHVTARIFPENATFTDIKFKALTLNGVESNCVKVVQNGYSADIQALGDGEFRLCCSCNNDKDHPEVLSELEFDITGMGTATYNPYELVSAISYADSNYELPLSFLGGVYITSEARTNVVFENVDFGDYGSDEIILPIFSFANQVPLEVWDGIPEEDGEQLLTATYEAKSWYNHYQENTFQLSKRLRGTHTLTIVVIPDIKMSLQGFYFTHYEKAFSKITALENARITGDMFHIEEDAITGIGNNVTIEYENMDFGETGSNSVTFCARSHIDNNAIHLHFLYEDDIEITQIVEIPFSENYEEHTFPLELVKGACKCNLIFLPGSNCDLKWFHFSKASD